MNFYALLPEIIVCLTALTIIGIDLFDFSDDKQRRGLMAYVASVGCVIALGVLLGWKFGGYTPFSGIQNSFVPDHTSWYFRVVLLISALLTTMISVDYVTHKIKHAGEFYTLICLATLGGLFLVSTTELLTLYLSIELLSISSFVLVSLRKDRPKSAEAAIKYLIFGAVSSGFLLYGLSFVFGETGSIMYQDINTHFLGLLPEDLNIQHLVMATFVIGGLCYKIAAVPFHMWAPDVYEGAPIPVTAFLAATSKVAGFVGLLRLLEVFNTPVLNQYWILLVALIATASMTLGNLLAMAQKDIKRLFAYSSIAHAGYLLVGAIAITEVSSREIALTGIYYYLLVYVLMNMGAFAAIAHLSQSVQSSSLRDFAGLGKVHPWLGFALACCLISLTGLPPFGGFTGKFYLFGSVIAMSSKYLWLVFVGVINSVVSIYYYSKIIKVMFFNAPHKEHVKSSAHPALVFASVVCFLGITSLFIYPLPIIDFISQINQLI